tara:strand:+ start:288 stop:464 length:177 start_codon:yes stop_codon:yes gene_type:complete
MSHISNDSVIDSVRDMDRQDKLDFLANHLGTKKIQSLLSNEKLSDLVLLIKFNDSEEG